MSGYYGTKLQKELQRRTFERRQQIAATPGLYNAGRFVGTDDPDKLGWDPLCDLLGQQGGVLGLRLITPAQGRSYYPRVVEQGCRIDTWDVFIADAGSVRPAVDAILTVGLPGGIVLGSSLSSPDGEDTVRVQQFVAENGMAPLPGSMLVDGPEQATVMLTDRHGQPVAVATAYFAHNVYSSHYRSAWVGMVTVAPARRGTGLGRSVNALAIQRAVTDLGAARVYELVAASNEPSRRMVAACGLSFDPELLCGVAVPAEAARFTR